jgi:hypothetical protein
MWLIPWFPESIHREHVLTIGTGLVPQNSPQRTQTETKPQRTRRTRRKTDLTTEDTKDTEGTTEVLCSLSQLRETP